jgi:hypothetical protein
MSRTIHIVPPITVKDPASGEPIVIGDKPYTYSMPQLVKWLVDTCKAFNESGVGIRASVRIEQTFAVGDVAPVSVTLSEEDWQRLRDAAETPDSGYPSLTARDGDKVLAQIPLARQMLPFIDAIAEAKE